MNSSFSIENSAPVYLRPLPLRAAPHLPLQPIQKIGALSVPLNFERWKAYPDTGLSYRPHRPVVEMTRELFQIYKDRSGSKSAEKIDRWVIDKTETIGFGSYASIFSATDALRKLPCVAKVNAPEVTRYEAAKSEYQSLHLWRNIPHVVKVLGAIDYPSDSQKCILMERLGPDLFSLIKSEGKLRFDVVLCIFRALLEMNKAASKRSLVHGDLSLPNIVYDQKKVIVLDFGLAHSIREKRFHPNCLQSLRYRAPEIILGRKYDTSADLWSIGCIIFMLFCDEYFVNSHPDDPNGQRDAIFQIVHRIGLPSPDYLLNSGFKMEEFPYAGFLDLGAKVQKEAVERGISEKDFLPFLDLLKGILRFENRISPDEALYRCNQILQNGTHANPSGDDQKTSL